MGSVWVGPFAIFGTSKKKKCVMFCHDRNCLASVQAHVHDIHAYFLLHFVLAG